MGEVDHSRKAVSGGLLTAYTWERVGGLPASVRSKLFSRSAAACRVTSSRPWQQRRNAWNYWSRSPLLWRW